MKPQKPTDAYVVNGWYLIIPIPGIGSDGVFETLEGVGKETGVVEIVDAGTNKKIKFADQIIDYSEMTLGRTYQGNATDRAIEVLVKLMMEKGLKLPVSAVKMHNGKEVFTILFEGFSFKSSNLPTLDTGGTEKFTVSYRATCDDWDIIPVGI